MKTAGTPASEYRQKRRWQRLGIAFYLPSAWIIFLLFLAFVAPLQDPLDADFLNPAAAPSAMHLLGTDSLGRDVLARVATGARYSLLIAAVAPIIGLAAALPMGMLAGYYRGQVDGVIGVLNDSLMAFPRIILAIAIIFYAGATLVNLIIVTSIFTFPNLLRIARSTTLSLTGREFVLASRALGASHARILLKDILPNVLPPTASYALMTMSIVVMLEGSLSFLGIGLPPPRPTWGKMISEGYLYLLSDPQLSIVPSLFMFLTILAFNLMGDQLIRLTTLREAKL